MTTLLRKTIDIRPGEWQRALIMAGYIFVIMASYNVLKPMARSLFVTNLSPSELPILYIILAAVVSLVSIGYLKLSTSLRIDRLITVTALFFAGNLVIFWLFLRVEEHNAPLYYTLFIWTSIYGILTSTQFWLLANSLFNAREAKRLFPFLTACAILGGILGGYLTRVWVDFIGGTANLSWVGVFFLVLAIGLVNTAWRCRDESIERAQRARDQEDERTTPKIISEVNRLIRQSKHLAFLVSIVGLTYMVVQIADFQFIAFASNQIRGTDELTGFLGFWLSNLSIAALLFQVFFAGFIIRKFGVGATILFLPAALLVTSIWFFASATLISVLALKMSDGAFRHSLNKVGTELLYLPISPDVKKKTKAFIDMFADRFARGFAGVLLLISYSWLGLSVSQISFVAIFLILIWLVFSKRAYREYVDSYRRALEKRQIDVDSLDFSIRDVQVINSLIISLASPNERQVIYALRTLESVEGAEDVEWMPPLRPLIHPKQPVEIRRRALKLLQKHGDATLLPQVKPLLRDQDQTIRRLAVQFYVKFSDESAEDLLRAFLNDSDFGLRGAALQYLGQQPKLAEMLLTTEILESFMELGPAGKVLVAETVGLLKDDKYYPFLTRLLKDSESLEDQEARGPHVRERAIISAGQSGCQEFVPLLIENLRWRSTRNVARTALATFGDSIADELASHLKNRELEPEIRASIIRVFESVGTQRSVEVLLDNLMHGTLTLRHPTIKALSKLRNRFSDLKFDKRVNEALLDELQEYFQIQATLYQTNGNSEHTNGSELLRRALEERLDDHLERIFRLLGLQYPPRDIYNAYAAANSSNRSIRANAIEFLDNILTGNYKEQLLLVVDDLPIEKVLERANGLLKVRFKNKKEALHYLLENGDPWLRACSIYEIGKSGMVKEFEAQIKSAAQERENLVKETATTVLEKFS